MKKLIICGVFSLVPLIACVQASEEEPAPEESSVEQAVTNCCIDYTCPSPDYITTGCRIGAGPTIREAYDECNAACPVQCQSSGLYCQ